MGIEQFERKAIMNPSAVEEAKVFSGLVYYFDGQHDHEIIDSPFVEVGKWTSAGAEQAPEDYVCTYYVALLLGLESNMSWLCAEEGNPNPEERTGERKYIIHGGFDENGLIIPLSPDNAIQLSEQINEVLVLAQSFVDMSQTNLNK